MSIGSTVKDAFDGTLTKEKSNSANSDGLNSSLKPSSLTGPAYGRASLRPIAATVSIGQISMLPRRDQLDDSAVRSSVRCSSVKSPCFVA